MFTSPAELEAKVAAKGRELKLDPWSPVLVEGVERAPCPTEEVVQPRVRFDDTVTECADDVQSDTVSGPAGGSGIPVPSTRDVSESSASVPGWIRRPTHQ